MVKEKIKQDAFFSLVPTAKDREYGVLDLTAILTALNIASWWFLTGAAIATYVPFGQAIPIMVFGQIIALVLITPTYIFFSRYGIEQFIGTRAIFGQRGADVMTLLFYALNLAWITVLGGFVGRSSVRLLTYYGIDLGFLTTIETGAPIIAIVLSIIGVYIAYKGPVVIKWATRMAASLLLVITLYFLFIVLTQTDVNLYAQPPLAPFESGAKNVAMAVEIAVGGGLGWMFFVGNYARLAKTEAAAVHGFIWGGAILSVLVGVFAAGLALIYQNYDPTSWFLELGGTLVVTLGLAFFIIANISSIGAIIYPISLTVKSRFHSLDWKYAIGIVGVPGLIFIMFPVVYNYYAQFLSFLAIVGGIYAAILVADLVKNNGGKIKMRALFDRKRGYTYWHGFNPAAVVAGVIGLIVYFAIWNPLASESYTGLFQYISAGLPTFFITAIIYFAVSSITGLDSSSVAAHDIPDSQAREVGGDD